MLCTIKKGSPSALLGYPDALLRLPISQIRSPSLLVSLLFFVTDVSLCCAEEKDLGYTGVVERADSVDFDKIAFGENGENYELRNSRPPNKDNLRYSGTGAVVSGPGKHMPNGRLQAVFLRPHAVCIIGLCQKSRSKRGNAAR